MRTMRAAMLAMLALGIGSGCVIYETVPDAGHDAGVRDSGPLPDGGDGIDPDPGNGGRDAGFPGSGLYGDPGMGVLFLIRIDRGTANFADRYSELVFQTLDGLERARLDVNAVGIAHLYRPELVYGVEGSAFPPEIAESLRAAAAGEGGTTEPTCTTSALAEIAANLPYLWAANQGTQPFARPLSAMLIVLIDGAARPYGPWDAPCAQDGTLAVPYYSRAHADWLNVLTPRSLPRPQVRFVTVSTPEGATSTQQVRETCAGLQGFPAGSADLIEASPIAFFSPFVAGLAAVDVKYARAFDFCPTVAAGWETAMQAFASEWAVTLRSQPPFP